MRIEPLGDSALIVRVVDDFARDPDESLNAVLAALRCLETAAIPGVTELAPAYSTIGLFFDVAEIARAASEQEPWDWLTTKIDGVLKVRSPKRKRGVEALPRSVERRRSTGT